MRLLTKVMPAIREKWPEGDKIMTTIIQQDNAKPHIHPDDPDIQLEGAKDGWQIKLACQPPNSPDFNVLDLGFFNSVQSIQQKKSARTIDELISNVENAYWSQTVEVTNFIF